MALHTFITKAWGDMMRSISILLVDSENDTFMRLTNSEIMFKGEFQFSLDYVSYGIDALDAFKFKRYDAVLLENQLPDMTGMELMQSLKALQATLPIIFLSFSERYEDVRRAIVGGAADYLLKSCDVIVLMSDLINILNLTNDESQNNLNILAIQIGRSILESKVPLSDHVYQFYNCLMAEICFEGDVLHQVAHGLEMILGKLETKPMKLSNSYLARRCSEWICDQDDLKCAFVEMVFLIQKVYEEILMPTQKDMLIRQAIYYVLEASESKKTVSYIAQKLFVNRTHLSEVFKKKTNISLSAYITRVKLYGALILLLVPNLSKDDILHILGNKDEAHFNASFKVFVGLTPNEYVQKWKKSIGKS
jgi:two-component system response regulator YesN